MKAVLFVSCFSLLAGCNLVSGSDDISVEVHMQSHFDEDNVSIQIDGRDVFSGRITTDHRIGLAERVTLQMAPGLHVISIQISGENLTHSFDTDDGTYLGVTYRSEVPPASNDEPSISLKISNDPFGYF